MAPEFRPSPEQERAEYDRHRNIDEPGYRHFLSRLAEPLLQRLAQGASGLDYGCGPGPVLATMLAERGHPTALFDPIYAADAGVLERSYDFVTCTEVAEHFHAPRQEFERLDGLLRPGGWLAVMTQLRRPDQGFSTWRYVHDPTHVCFYEWATLQWIADWRGWQLLSVGDNVALFWKAQQEA